jgi:hypothetical protein
LLSKFWKLRTRNRCVNSSKSWKRQEKTIVETEFPYFLNSLK